MSLTLEERDSVIRGDPSCLTVEKIKNNLENFCHCFFDLKNFDTGEGGQNRVVKHILSVMDKGELVERFLNISLNKIQKSRIFLHIPDLIEQQLGQVIYSRLINYLSYFDESYNELKIEECLKNDNPSFLNEMTIFFFRDKIIEAVLDGKRRIKEKVFSNRSLYEILDIQKYLTSKISEIECSPFLKKIVNSGEFYDMVYDGFRTEIGVSDLI